MAAILNEIVLKKQIEKLSQGKSFQKFAYNAANTRLVAAKNQLLEDFDDDEVIKEMIESSKNPAITTSEIVSKGNLTAFLGLYPGQGASQVQELRNMLKYGISMDVNAKIEFSKNKVSYSFKVRLPTKKDMNEKAELGDWTSKSWIEIIENGVSKTVNKFIFWSEGFKSGSKSGTGLQTSGKVTSPAQLTPTPFMSRILDIFREKF